MIEAHESEKDDLCEKIKVFPSQAHSKFKRDTCVLEKAQKQRRYDAPLAESYSPVAARDTERHK